MFKNRNRLTDMLGSDAGAGTLKTLLGGVRHSIQCVVCFTPSNKYFGVVIAATNL